MLSLPRSFFQRPAPAVAHDLIGTLLLVSGVGGIVVEAEAYDHHDPASHSYRGPTARNAAMFGPAGHAYVYRSHGLHWCFDIVCGEKPLGSAVLVRALEPVRGLDLMRQRRGVADPRLLCAGPGRLTQALGITGALDGKPLDQPPFLISAGQAPPDVVSGPRIGLTRGGDTPWRFGWAGSAFLSRPFRP
ncbi:DNA-3-methyladenine glycosylase [Teichococcus wenyumeiae]|uniref:DNA-3-methyladenine glycosylase n=1 Tax=Teichococcus wenyumeiae TaxID=2478470 RepID=UPI001F3C46C8|nr:DNA-3-methyladenine glycosylase [Pseudoroseomonas wenyumeiae]